MKKTEKMRKEAEDLAHELICDIEENKKTAISISSTVSHKRKKYHFKASLEKIN